MTDENINLVLTNVMCCLGNYGVKVSKLLSINDSCAESEVIKLKLLHDYYEAVRCYNTTPVVTVEGTVLPEIIRITTLNSSELYFNSLSELDFVYDVSVLTDITIGLSFTGDGVKTVGELIVETLTTAGYYISHTMELIDNLGIISCIYTFTLRCDVRGLAVNHGMLGVFGTEIQRGSCGTEVSTSPENCLTQEEFDILINRLMKACDICPCQLIQ